MSKNLSVFAKSVDGTNTDHLLTIPYNMIWSDLEAMFRALLDCEQVAISYIDMDNDEITISSQEELSEAFQVAMKMGDKLHVKMLSLDGKAGNFRMSDSGMAASQTDVGKRTNGVQQTDNVTCPTSKGNNNYLNPDGLSWEQVNGELKDQSGLCERNSYEKGEKLEQLLQYSDFVTFMTKLKRDLRVEIVRDVTRKTVKQVLKGLDGAVIESLHGSNLVPVGVNTSVTGAPKSLGGSEHTVYTHDGVYCDVCNCTIVGSRYKCGNCEDFDLCEACEDKPNMHNPDHVFIKIRRPCVEVGVKDGVRRPLLKESIYRVHKKTKLLVPIPRNEESNENDINSKLESKLRSIVTHRDEKRKRKDEKKIAKLKKKEEKIKRRMEGFNESSRKHERMELLDDKSAIRYDFYKVMMSAMFVADISIPDRSKVPSEMRFVKTWRMKNDGDGPWSHSTKLKLAWGSIPTPTNEVDVPPLQPGEEGNINVDFVAPIEPGEYQSHWKLHENGMPFGLRIWCIIEVVPKEILEPTGLLNDSLKVISEMHMSENGVREEDIQPENSKNNTIRIRPFDDGQSKEFLIKCEEFIQKNLTGDISTHDVANSDEIEDVKINKETKNDDNLDKTGAFTGNEEFVVYVKHGDNEVSEVESKDQIKESEISMSLSAHDLTTAVARLTLESEKQDMFPCVSYTTTPNNTPFDVTPLKTPNPEPEDEAEDGEKDQQEMRRISDSSSLELVTTVEQEYEYRDLDHMLVKERMASLELKPEINLESVSSCSDDDDYDDDSSLSDSDYIIVPVPDCFDLSKPLQHPTSGYSNSHMSRSNDEEFLLDNTHKTSTSSSNSRAASFDEILTTSSSLSMCLLSPIPSSNLPQSDDQEITAPPNMDDELFVVSTLLDQEATSEERFHSSDVNGSDYIDQQSNCGTVNRNGKPNSVSIMIGSETQDQHVGGESCHVMPTLGSSLGTAVALSDPGIPTPIHGNVVDSHASGASSAHNSDTQKMVQIPGSDVTDDQTCIKEPLLAAPKLENVNFVKAPPKKAPFVPMTVDFAPEFANQLVATAVNAAGQAYITAKAVFKTWSDKQDRTLASKPKQSPKGWKPASTQWTPPEASDFNPPHSEWKPPSTTFKPPQSEWKPLSASYKPPSASYKPPQSEWKPPVEAALNLPKESGKMGRLLEMGFNDRDLNRKLLLKYKNDIEKVLQELLSKKN